MAIKKATQYKAYPTLDTPTIGIQNETTRNMYVSWSVKDWGKDPYTGASLSGDFEYFEVNWYYYTGNGIWFKGDTHQLSDRTYLIDTYSAPQNATKVRVRIAAISLHYIGGDDEEIYFFIVPQDKYASSEYSFAGNDEGSSVSAATDLTIGAVSQEDSTVFATWTWNQSNTANYDVEWQYQTRDGKWFNRTKETLEPEDRISTFDVPENAVQVAFRVKPISKTHILNGWDMHYWTANWSSWKYYDVAANEKLPTPSAPTVSLKDYTATIVINYTFDELVYSKNKPSNIEFQVIENNNKVVKTISDIPLAYYQASTTFTVAAGNKYKVRCRCKSSLNLYSDWSEYSQEIAAPLSTPSITSLAAQSSTSVRLNWSYTGQVERIRVEYISDTPDFDFNPGKIQSTDVEVHGTYTIIDGLTTGAQYYFRVASINESDALSSWSAIKSIILGRAPSAPTTWSSTTTVMVGEPLTLYWTHNAEDGSSQVSATLRYTTSDNPDEYVEVEILNSTDEFEKDLTSRYDGINTSLYSQGTEIIWQIRTRGVSLEYSEWSVKRSIKIYAKPYLHFFVGKYIDWYWDPFDFENDRVDAAYGVVRGMEDHVLREFPMVFTCDSGPQTQTPVGYSISIASLGEYSSTNDMGEEETVYRDQVIFSKYIPSTKYSETLWVDAKDVTLANGQEYIATLTLYMNSGLTATETYTFTVSWDFLEYYPQAEMALNSEDASMVITPYCLDNDENLIENTVLSVYRKDPNGSFVEIAKDLENTRISVIDPHPSLNYAYYRIICKHKAGNVTFTDLPGYPVNEKAIVIQWDENWRDLTDGTSATQVERMRSGSLIRFPYNVDVSDSNTPDVSLINYIGRDDPISYYGTQRGIVSTWNAQVVKADADTLYQLRRLQRWMGDVYVREPSGSGYWAQLKVSFSQKHTELTIPVTFNITKVCGGV